MQYNGLIQAPKAKNLKVCKKSQSHLSIGLWIKIRQISQWFCNTGIVTSNKATIQEEIQHYMNLKLLLK